MLILIIIPMYLIYVKENYLYLNKVLFILLSFYIEIYLCHFITLNSYYICTYNINMYIMVFCFCKSSHTLFFQMKVKDFYLTKLLLFFFILETKIKTIYKIIKSICNSMLIEMH